MDSASNNSDNNTLQVLHNPEINHTMFNRKELANIAPQPDDSLSSILSSNAYPDYLHPRPDIPGDDSDHFMTSSAPLLFGFHLDQEPSFGAHSSNLSSDSIPPNEYVQQPLLSPAATPVALLDTDVSKSNKPSHKKKGVTEASSADLIIPIVETELIGLDSRKGRGRSGMHNVSIANVKLLSFPQRPRR